MTMTMGIEIDDSDYANVVKKLSDRRTRLGPQIAVAAAPLETYVERIGTQATRYARDEAPEDRGKLRRGISFVFRGNMGAVISQAKHTVYVIKGRGADKAFPPIDRIRSWVVRHGMPPSAAFPVARAIAERGIEPDDFLQRAFDRMMLRDVPMTKRKFVKQVEARWRR